MNNQLWVSKLASIVKILTFLLYISMYSCLPKMTKSNLSASSKSKSIEKTSANPKSNNTPKPIAPSMPPKTTNLTKPSSSQPSNSKFDVEMIKNKRLKTFVNEWLNIKYAYNGNSKSGIDCSHFACTLLRNVYDMPPNFYAPSHDLAAKFRRVAKDSVKQGDLIFFDINRNGRISHVGVVLDSEHFIHASTKRGVVISSINEDYYITRISHYGAVAPLEADK